MADAGGVVYLLSSYQRGREVRAQRGRGDEGERREERRPTDREGKDNVRTPCSSIAAVILDLSSAALRNSQSVC